MDEPEHTPTRRRTRRRVIAVLAVVVVAWLLVAVVQVVAAGRSAQRGLDSVDAVGQLATDDLPTFLGSIGGAEDDVAEETAAQHLRVAADAFGETGDRLDSPAVAPLRLLPVLGRQFRSVDALASAAEVTASEGAVAFAALEAQLSGTAQTPEERMATARTTEEVLVDLQNALSDLDLGPSDKLLPPLASARNRFTEEYERTMTTLDTAVVAVTGINDFLEGPNRYLVLAANNAEMRAGSGMFLQVGVLDVDQGRFELGDFTPAAELRSDQPGTVVDPDIAGRWGWLEPDREWRNLNLSPRFDESARMAADMWAAGGHGEVDGVIAVDVVGLESLLDIIGPVEVDSGAGPTTVSADTVAQDLLLEQYQDFADDTDLRRDRLGTVAGAIFESFNTRSWSASSLLRSLQKSGAGRHILLWSNEPEQQAGWEQLGASGQVHEDALLLSILNRGGNKLDQFLEVDADLSAVTTAEGRRVRVEISMGNAAPRTLPLYVEGPHPNSGLTQGDYLGLVSLTIPSGAGNATVEGGELLISGDDGATRILVTEVLIPQGAQHTVSMEFDLPGSWETIEVIPSARVPSVKWHAGPNTWTDDRPVVVDLDEDL